MYQEPTSHKIDPATGGMTTATGCYRKRLRDLAGIYAMLMETPEGETRVLEVTPGVAVYVPPMWVHRSVNVGAAALVMSFFYPSDSGQDYGIIARSCGMASLIVADGTGWREIPNPKYRPRGPDEIARVLATQS